MIKGESIIMAYAIIAGTYAVRNSLVLVPLASRDPGISTRALTSPRGVA